MKHIVSASCPWITPASGPTDLSFSSVPRSPSGSPGNTSCSGRLLTGWTSSRHREDRIWIQACCCCRL
ncbi:hypothetical protein LINPERPRIM_LOCUS4163 [Linum perenne]